jgi:hypothetical protein
MTLIPTTIITIMILRIPLGALEASKLKTLVLSFNGITDSAASSIGALLEKSNSLTFFDISYNKLGKNAALAIAAAIPKLKKMTTMYLGFNFFGFKQTIELVQSVKDAPTCLTYVGIENSMVDGPNCDAQIQSVFNYVYLANKERKAVNKVRVVIEFPPRLREYIASEDEMICAKPAPQPLPLLFEARTMEADSRAWVNTNEVKRLALDYDFEKSSIKTAVEKNGGIGGLGDVHQVLLHHYQSLVDIYAIYCSKTTANPVMKLFMNTMTSLVVDANITDGLTKLSDIDRIFITTYSKFGTEKSLTRTGFIEFTVRVAIHKFYNTGLASTVAEAVEMLIANHYLKHIRQVSADYFRRSEMIYNTFVNRVFHSLKSSLSELYEHFSSTGNQPGNKKAMYVADFLAMCTACDLVSELSRETILKVFNTSKMLCVEDAANRDRADSRRYPTDALTFTDFLEAIVRLAINRAMLRDGTSEIDIQPGQINHYVGLLSVQCISSLEATSRPSSQRVWKNVRKQFGSKTSRQELRFSEKDQQYYVNQLLQGAIHRTTHAQVSHNESLLQLYAQTLSQSRHKSGSMDSDDSDYD